MTLTSREEVYRPLLPRQFKLMCSCADAVVGQAPSHPFGKIPLERFTVTADG